MTKPMTEDAPDNQTSIASILLTWLWRAGLAVLALLLLALAWLVAFDDLYKAGSPLGYNLGLAGGLMMLTLLLYPLRKRLAFMGRLGAMRHWFRYHMLLGIGGPLLILFHSTFKVGSMNARVALYSMLLVAFSGIVGRFVYRHIHRGLYGSKMTLAEAERDLQGSADDMRSVLALAPAIGDRLKDFQRHAFAEMNGFARAWRFVTLRWRGHRLARAIRREAGLALQQAARASHWTGNERKLHWELAKTQVDAYIDAVCQASQFSAWERLFSLWHVVHVPFLYLLLISGIVHVFAVHMY